MSTTISRVPIPHFDGNLVLPPHLGDPRHRGQLSPYPCTTFELCEKFATSAERLAILQGFLELRATLTAIGVTNGFQWVGGSFLEDIEASEHRPPNDIDVVTCFDLSPEQIRAVSAALATSADGQALLRHDTSKVRFKVDHFLADIRKSPELTVEETRYWLGLFSHRRDAIWKGLLRIQLNTLADDDAALRHLQAQAVVAR